jgi:hypothetical protein
MKTISKQSIVISIILLLIGVSVSSATTNVVKQSLIKDNQPPNPPDIIGPTMIPVGKDITLSFYAIDPDGDNVSYYVEWGDGTSDGWTSYVPSGQPVDIAHTWDKVNCDNVIRAKAKDIHDNESDWGYRDIPIVKSKDCGCEEVSRSDIIRVERLIDRVEVYSKLLLVLSRYTPEVREDYEEIYDMISTLNTLGLKDAICISLGIIETYFSNKGDYYLKLCLFEDYEDREILLFILIFITMIYFGLYMYTSVIFNFLGC